MAFDIDLLNVISDFRYEVDGKEICFTGILQKENDNIVLNTRIPKEQCRRMEKNYNFIVLGNIAGKKLTLVGCSIM